MNAEQRSQLIDALVEGDISEADFVLLEAEMLVNPEVRQEYYARVELDSLIDVETRDRSSADEDEKVIRFPRRVTVLQMLGGMAAAFLLGAIVIPQLSFTPPVITSQDDNEPVASGFGVIAEHIDARWSDKTRTIQRGEILPQGLLTLASGLVQIDLFSGVSLIVEGSADFEILSPMEIRIDSGKVRANVPEQARGFRVHTAAGEVVDLGTEFAVEVTADHADVHVLEGEIEWHPVDRDMQLMVKGEALRASGTTETPLPHQAGRFVGIDEIAANLARSRSERRQNWMQHSSKLAEDQRLLLYYPMSANGDWARQLADASSRDISGSIVRADRVSDRWGFANAALDFTPAGSRVRVEVPGIHQSLTFYCWVRIDSLDRWYNSLFLTDGHELNEPHWQILNDGRLFFSVKKNDPEVTKGKRDKHIYYSPKIWTPAQSGQWFQIATTYDTEARQVFHYVNGEIVSREQIAEEWLVENVNIGAASIGNWSEPRYKRDDPSFAIRNLNGVIDEFAIFSTAISPQEIRNLYQIGKP